MADELQQKEANKQYSEEQFTGRITKRSRRRYILEF